MTVAFRRATADDLPTVVALLRDDALGSTREHGDLRPYQAAFAEIDADHAPGVTTAEAQRIKDLEAEVRELRRANEKLFGLQRELSDQQRLASMGQLATIANKEAVNAAFETPLGEGLKLERRLFYGLFATKDQKEGMAAFIEKRPAKFENR